MVLSPLTTVLVVLSPLMTVWVTFLQNRMTLGSQPLKSDVFSKTEHFRILGHKPEIPGFRSQTGNNGFEDRHPTESRGLRTVKTIIFGILLILTHFDTVLTPSPCISQ